MQQQINYREQLHENVGFNVKQINQNQPDNRNLFNAEKRKRQLEKTFYINFSPYQHYFNNRSLYINLFKNKSKFDLHSNLYDRQRLSLERQSMYYRGAVDQFFSEELLNQYIQEAQLQKGFINKNRNKSLIIQNILYYAHQSVINAIQIPKLNAEGMMQIYQESVQPLKMFQFQQGNLILEIQQLKKSVLNSESPKNIILVVRFSRKVVILDLHEKKVVHQIFSSNQFLQHNVSLYQKNIFEVIQYDGEYSTFTSYQLSNQLNEIKSKSQFKIKQAVHSAFNINRNEMVLTKYDGLFIFDKRTRNEQNIHRVNNISKQRFYNTIPIKGFYSFTPFIASCQSRHISIFDIRKPDCQVSKYYHQCQQSPPQILKFYEGTTNNQLMYPILACHSPYKLGSSLFTNLDLEKLQLLSEKQTAKSQIYLNSNYYFNLLYDHGKSSPKTNLHQIFNSSLSFYNDREGTFTAFQISNTGSVSMEMFQYNQFKDAYKSRIFRYSNDKNIKFASEQENYSNSYQWFRENMISKYLNSQIKYENINQEKYIPSVIKGKKKNSKIKKGKAQECENSKKKQKKKEDLTQISDIEILEGLYQNQSECQQTFAKRKLNFADLNKFNLILQIKASKEAPSQKYQQKQISLNNTQFSTQGFTFSQNLSEQYETKALSFHNKKLMNFSILQKLKNDWDN